MSHQMLFRQSGITLAVCCLAALAMASSVTGQPTKTRTLEKYKEQVKPFRNDGEVSHQIVASARSKMISNFQTSLTNLPVELDAVSIFLGDFSKDLYLADAQKVTPRMAIFRLTRETEYGRIQTNGFIKLTLRPSGILKAQVSIKNSALNEEYFHHPGSDDKPTIAAAPAIPSNTVSDVNIYLYTNDDEMFEFQGALDVRRNIRQKTIRKKDEVFEVMHYTATGQGVVTPFVDEEEILD